MKHKDHYNDTYILDLSNKIHSVIDEFDKDSFYGDLCGKLDDKELFARFDLIVDAMEKYLGSNYSDNISAFFDILGDELSGADGMFNFGWWLWPIGRYVERHGLSDVGLSLSFIKELTKRFTGEYAIRPLLSEHPAEVIDELIKWTHDSNVHVRRLASEGVRIRLPWSKKLYAALEEFDKYVVILTNLKDDPEKFVQKSVGNNLNDLFKDAPDKAKYIIDEWEKTEATKARIWIVKHGMRNQK